ncbi:sensor histidine kinase [Miniphocaeibacter sp.]|uniref:sensor histidine kinase n=2 Tax=Miniphocaeibacter sp. TaxID=3100973 RepID=UPI003BAF36F7
MLVKLKRKFIIITMSLVSFVLLAILVGFYVFIYRFLNQDIDNRLKSTTLDSAMGVDYSFEERIERNNFVFVYLKEGNYYKPINTDANLLPDEKVTISILEKIEKQNSETGSIKMGINQIRFFKIDNYVSYTVVNEDLNTLALIAKMLVTAFITAFVFIFFIAKYLASWALEPVEKAWYMQKQFIADASHELKTPLTVILANLKILKRYNNLTEEQNKWVNNTNDEAIRMKDLVEEMLYLAKGDVEQNNLHYSDVNFSELVEEVILTFESIAFEKGLTIEYDNFQEDIIYCGDRQQLKRLLIILVDNACKYSDTGNEIEIELSKSEKKIIFKITSIGNIIDKKNADKIFERFIRESESRMRNSEGGYGLGLAIAKNIVDNHKGKIRWEPYKDIGNTFIVELNV